MTQNMAILTGVVTVEALGKAIKQLRDNKLMTNGKTMTLTELEHLAEFDKGNLSRLEGGKLAPGKSGYSHKSLGRIADALGTPISQIYALAEEIENGRATPDTVRLVTAIASLPLDSQVTVQKVTDSLVKSAPWDKKRERREAG